MLNRGWNKSLTMKGCAAALTFLIAFGQVHADAVDDLVRAEMKRQHIPGLSLAVVKNGKIIKEKGFGLANVEHSVPVSPRTVFQSASVGKQFTSALTMLLVQDGKLKLDEPVSTYLPNTPETWSRITVRHLLTHTSGLDAVDKAIDLQKNYSEDELLTSAFKVALLSAPGQSWSYSNLGYQVLGVLCSRVGGKFYGDQLRERVFMPSGMQTRIISERNIVPHRAAGYDRNNGVLTNQDWVSPSLNTTGDGSLHLTARDLARWSIALEGDRVLSKSIKDASWTPVRLNDGGTFDYGFGWTLESIDGRKVVRHQGDWQGFTTHIIRHINDRLAVAVLINRSQAQAHVIVERIAAHYLPTLRSALPVPPTATLIASTPMYLRGDMNDWGLRDRLKMTEPGVYEVQVALRAGKQAFKFASEDWRKLDFGSLFDEPVTDVGKAKPLEFQGGNLTVETASAGTYLIRVDVRKVKRPLLSIKLLTGS